MTKLYQFVDGDVKTTLNQGGTLTAGATSFTVTSASGFPTDGDFYVLFDATGTSELVKVTAVSGTTFTCVATSSNHNDGVTIDCVVTAEMARSMQTIYDTYANLPSPSQRGRLFIPSDSPEYYAIDDGAAWHWFLPPYGLVVPPAGRFTGHNPGSGSLTDRGASTTFSMPAQGSENWRGGLASVTAPYTIIAIVTLSAVAGTSSRWAPILLRESGSGKMIHLGFDAATGGFTTGAVALKWTNDTTYAGSSYSLAAHPNNTYPTYCLKFVDDGTHRFFYTSSDGLNWGDNLIGTLLNNDFCVPDQAGFGMSFSYNFGPNRMFVRSYSIT